MIKKSERMCLNVLEKTEGERERGQLFEQYTSDETAVYRIRQQ